MSQDMERTKDETIRDEERAGRIRLHGETGN